MKYECPECTITCKSKAGLTRHINAIHLHLSPSQVAQKKKYLLKKFKKETEEVILNGHR